MTICFCKAIMAALIVLFAWWACPWLGSKWAITILGVALVLWALFVNDKCCCTSCAAPVTAAKPVVKKVAVKKK